MPLRGKKTAAEAAVPGGKAGARIATLAGSVLTGSPARHRRVASVETIEARLDRKAADGDSREATTESLGQMSREQRHKLLYGD